jgi:hypothetical protein
MCADLLELEVEQQATDAAWVGIAPAPRPTWVTSPGSRPPWARPESRTAWTLSGSGSSTATPGQFPPAARGPQISPF